MERFPAVLVGRPLERVLRDTGGLGLSLDVLQQLAVGERILAHIEKRIAEHERGDGKTLKRAVRDTRASAQIKFPLPVVLVHLLVVRLLELPPERVLSMAPDDEISNQNDVEIILVLVVVIEAVNAVEERRFRERPLADPLKAPAAVYPGELFATPEGIRADRRHAVGDFDAPQFTDAAQPAFRNLGHAVGNHQPAVRVDVAVIPAQRIVVPHQHTILDQEVERFPAVLVGRPLERVLRDTGGLGLSLDVLQQLAVGERILAHIEKRIAEHERGDGKTLKRAVRDTRASAQIKFPLPVVLVHLLVVRLLELPPERVLSMAPDDEISNQNDVEIILVLVVVIEAVNAVEERRFRERPLADPLKAPAAVYPGELFATPEGIRADRRHAVGDFDAPQFTDAAQRPLGDLGHAVGDHQFFGERTVKTCYDAIFDVKPEVTDIDGLFVGRSRKDTITKFNHRLVAQIRHRREVGTPVKGVGINLTNTRRDRHGTEVRHVI